MHAYDCVERESLEMQDCGANVYGLLVYYTLYEIQTVNILTEMLVHNNYTDRELHKRNLHV